MKIFGRTWSQYFTFVRGALVLLTVMFALRWLLSELHAPAALTRYLSVSTASILIVVYLPLKVHTRKFGSYPQLAVLYLIIGLWLNLLISLGILVAALTGRDNVYSSIGHLGQASGYATHILAHLTVFVSLFTLEYFAIGSLLLYMIRRFDAQV